jgi:hypothetical protein
MRSQETLLEQTAPTPLAAQVGHILSFLFFMKGKKNA